MPKTGNVEDYEIWEKIFTKEEIYIKKSGEKRRIDNTYILNRPIYYVDGDLLILSSITIKDIFMKFVEMNKKMKDIKK
jgi:hypothetical protein